MTDVDHSKWLKRPMNETSLLYAAEDICKIQQLYNVFVEEDYIDEETLVPYSASYLALNVETRPNEDKYRMHGLLPLAVFPSTAAFSLSMQCQGCKRNLPASSFLPSAAQGRSPHLCFVCKAVDTSGKLTRKWRK